MNSRRRYLESKLKPIVTVSVSKIVEPKFVILVPVFKSREPV